MLVDLRETAISAEEVIAAVSHERAGAIVPFLGVVRSRNEGRDVTRLDYEAYAPMAIAEMRRVAEEIIAREPGVRLAVIHRVGSLTVGDIAVACAASAEHRGEAFRAAEALIDGIKARAPIWKREYGEDGAVWVGWVDARCEHH